MKTIRTLAVVVALGVVGLFAAAASASEYGYSWAPPQWGGSQYGSSQYGGKQWGSSQYGGKQWGGKQHFSPGQYHQHGKKGHGKMRPMYGY